MDIIKNLPDKVNGLNDIIQIKCLTQSLAFSKHSIVGVQLLSPVWLFCCPVDRSLPGSSVHGSGLPLPPPGGSSWPRYQTYISCDSCTAGGFFTIEPPRKSTDRHSPNQIALEEWSPKEAIQESYRIWCNQIHAEILLAVTSELLSPSLLPPSSGHLILYPMMGAASWLLFQSLYSPCYTLSPLARAILLKHKWDHDSLY